MVAIKRAIEPYEKQKAKERMLAGKPSVNLMEGKGETLDKIAGFVGVSRNTLKKTEILLKQQNKIQNYTNHFWTKF